jgi:hypothetical protein
MLGLLRTIFFHLGFWPRLAGRWASLWLTTDYLKVEEIGLDSAFYIEGSWVLVHWKVENAWLVRVNHPGGFYHGSDQTWMSARPGMPPVKITVYGTRQTLRYSFAVPVKPLEKHALASRHLSAQLQVAHLERGPSLRPQAARLFSTRLPMRRDLLPLWPNADHPSPGMQMQTAVWEARDQAALDLVAAAYRDSPDFTALSASATAPPTTLTPSLPPDSPDEHA